MYQYINHQPDSLKKGTVEMKPGHLGEHQKQRKTENFAMPISKNKSREQY